jgi:hypothetical protein
VGSRTALTPSLSPGERGKRASVVGHSKSVVCALSRGAEDFWMKVRPHPGPLPRERGGSTRRRSPVSLKSCQRKGTGHRAAGGLFVRYNLVPADQGLG